MTLGRRKALVAAAVLPASCAIQSLPSLSTAPIPPPHSPEPLRAPRVGHAWRYRKLNFFNSSVLDEVQETVASVASTIDIHRRAENGSVLADETHAAWGQLLRDPAWDYPMSFEVPVPLWPPSLAVGANASLNTHYRLPVGSLRFWIQLAVAARGWERVSVAAGTFDTLRIERLIRLDHQDHTRVETLRQDTLWLSPAVGRWVARDTSGRYRMAGSTGMWRSYAQEDHIRWELTAWQ